MVAHSRIVVDETLDLTVLVERLKRLRALNRKPEKIGLTEYTWRSFSINRIK